MKDEDIVQLYLRRDQRALAATAGKYGKYCTAIARSIFVCRYWYSDSISDIAKRYNMAEGAVSTTLSRLRAELREYLSERGFEL